MSRQESKIEKIGRVSDLLRCSTKRCGLCPRRCMANRQDGHHGYCRAPSNAVIYGHLAHHGEEPPISGRSGSGTIFFTHCNMKCVYCQNYYFSQLDSGKEASTEELARIMLELGDKGCHNINLVNPVHFIPHILDALRLAYERGLDIPIIYNSSGYETVETLTLLDGIIDIYLPDMRYSDETCAVEYSDAKDYVRHNRPAIAEMHRQVGTLVTDRFGIAERGLIVRLLVMPDAISGTKESLAFIESKISDKTYLSIMSQYYPTYRAYDFARISRGLNTGEYMDIVREARRLKLNNGWIQEGPRGFNERFLGTNITENSS